MKKTQLQKVVDRIHEVGYVDNFWCIKNYILRLGAIIFQLKEQGWEFRGGFGTGINKKNFIYEPTKFPNGMYTGVRTIIGPDTVVINGKSVPVFSKKVVTKKEQTNRLL